MTARGHLDHVTCLAANSGFAACFMAALAKSYAANMAAPFASRIANIDKTRRSERRNSDTRCRLQLLCCFVTGGPMVDTQVLIVGAGPVGLILAVDLGLRGVRCT